MYDSDSAVQRLLGEVWLSRGLLGPPKALIAVLTEYKKNLRVIGGSLNEDEKCGPTWCRVPVRATCRFHSAEGVIYDGPGGKTGSIVGYGVVCVEIPIGDPAFVKTVTRRLLEFFD